MAVRMNLYGKALLPAERWQSAVQSLYPSAIPAQKKAGPRGTFLGLCEAGLVKGIAGGDYSAGSRNKDYAVAAVALLKAGTHTTVTQLWAAVTQPEIKAHDAQMDVVLALWKNSLIA